MIRFKCPRCQKVLKVVAEGAGRKIDCPKCGQAMLIPTPTTPAPASKTVLGQLVAAPLSGSAASVQADTDNLVLLGLRKDADLEGKSENHSHSKAERSRAGTLFAVFALILAFAAMPTAVIHHPLLGAGLATFGLCLALLAVFKLMFRRGLGLAAVALMVGGSVLFSIVVLAGGLTGLLRPVKERLAALRPQDSRRRVEDLSDWQMPPDSDADQTQERRTEESNPKKGRPKQQPQWDEDEDFPANTAPNGGSSNEHPRMRNLLEVPAPPPLSATLRSPLFRMHDANLPDDMEGISARQRRQINEILAERRGVCIAPLLRAAVIVAVLAY